MFRNKNPRSGRIFLNFFFSLIQLLLQVIVKVNAVQSTCVDLILSQ